jgi:hypothetical protein
VVAATAGEMGLRGEGIEGLLARWVGGRGECRMQQLRHLWRRKKESNSGRQATGAPKPHFRKGFVIMSCLRRKVTELIAGMWFWGYLLCSTGPNSCGRECVSVLQNAEVLPPWPARYGQIRGATPVRCFRVASALLRRGWPDAPDGFHTNSIGIPYNFHRIQALFCYSCSTGRPDRGEVAVKVFAPQRAGGRDSE